MKKNIFNPLIILSLALLPGNLIAQDNTPGFKTTLDMTMNESGSVICEVTNKYTASYWDWWTKAIGSNTSIINNQLKKLFPKYHLSDFKHSQDPNERTNTVKFKIDGMMNINKNGKWQADLDQKDPNITKVSNKEWLLIDGGETLKLHLPAGTNDSKLEKNSFGKAILTYSPTTSGGMGSIMKYAGILIALIGIVLLIRNLMSKKTRTVSAVSAQEMANVQKGSGASINLPNEISSN